MELGFRLLAITPPTGSVDPALVEVWRVAAQTVGLAVLLREPGVEPAALVAEDHRLAPLRRACARAGVPWLLSVDPARVSALRDVRGVPGLRGAQLRGDPGPREVHAARGALGEGFVLGRSCHGVPAAMGGVVDYSVLAPIFPPRTASPHPGPGKRAVGLRPLRALAAVEPHVFALGGITPERAPGCARSGAFGLAAIRSFFGPVRRVADDVARLARALTERDDASEPADDAAPP